MRDLDYDEIGSLSQLLDAHGAKLLRRFWVALPCRVLKYDATKRKAQLEVLVADPYQDERGDIVRDTRPVLVEVPIIFPSMGGFRLSFPVKEGDEVLAIFTSCSLAYWLAKGGKVDEDASRRGHLSDAVAVIGLQSFARAQAVPDDRVSLGNDDRTVEIAIDGNEVRIGDNTASDYVALASKVENYLTALGAAVASWTPVANDGGAAFKAQLTAQGIGTTPGWGDDCAATKVKAK